eukprot:scaffold1860_cov403-Prasinococcus_capsulatus_cf.AAC.20
MEYDVSAACTTRAMDLARHQVAEPDGEWRTGPNVLESNADGGVAVAAAWQKTLRACIIRVAQRAYWRASGYS